MTDRAVGILFAWIGDHPIGSAVLLYGSFLALVLAGLLWPRRPGGRY